MDQPHHATACPEKVRRLADRVPDLTPSEAVDGGAPDHHRVFGVTLTTDRPLPGLPVAELLRDGQIPFWTLRTHDVAAMDVVARPGATDVGQFRYSNGTLVTLASHCAGHDITVADTGRFGLSTDGRKITHDAPPGVDRAAVALDLIGVVLPFTLHRDGAWCLHASAVATPSGVIAFLAPRGTGKSTLATACVTAGCALVADDVVVMRQREHNVTVTPAGLPLRLRGATARAVGFVSQDVAAWGKVRLDAITATADLPLAAIYVLTPVAATGDIARVARDTRAAALALVANGKITELLGRDLTGDVLSRCVAMAHVARVYDLAVPRDLARLDDVARALLTWHAAPDVCAAGASVSEHG